MRRTGLEDYVGAPERGCLQDPSPAVRTGRFRRGLVTSSGLKDSGAGVETVEEHRVSKVKSFGTVVERGSGSRAEAFHGRR